MWTVIPFLFLFFFLSSCANIGKQDFPVETIKGVDLEGARKDAIQEKGLFVCGDWPERNWRDDFQDAALSKAIEDALKDNPFTQSLKARVMAVKEKSAIVKSKLVTQINALFNLLWVYFSKDAQKQFPNVDPNFHFYTVGLDFT